jgi:hypothetical protein
MKTTNLFLRSVMAIFFAILFTAVSTSAFAGKPAKPWAIHHKYIQDKIAQTVQFPEDCFTKGHNGECAEITFMLAEDGKIVVKNVNCQCKEMEECIRKQLGDVYCPDAMHPYNQHYRIKITFKNC